MSIVLPTDAPGIITDVPVSWLMENLCMSVDGYTLFECNRTYIDDCYCGNYCPPIGINWDMLTCEKRDSYYSRLREDALVNGIQKPICVYSARGSFGYQHESAPTPFGLGNGHHRITLAIDEDFATLSVFWTASSEYMATEYTTAEWW